MIGLTGRWLFCPFIVFKNLSEVLNELVYNEKTIASEKKFEGRIISVRVDTVKLPEDKISYREIVDHPGGVGVVAITEEENVVLVKQFRKAIEKEILEIPAGKLEKGEDPLLCGIRELKEETGYEAEEFIPLGFIYPSPGILNETTYIYLARGLSKGEASPDENEYIDVFEYSFKELYDAILNNDISDAKTVSGFLKAMEYIKNEKSL